MTIAAALLEQGDNLVGEVNLFATHHPSDSQENDQGGSSSHRITLARAVRQVPLLYTKTVGLPNMQIAKTQIHNLSEIYADAAATDTLEHFLAITQITR